MEVRFRLTARLRRVDRHNNYTNFRNIVKFTLVPKVGYILLPLGMFIKSVIDYVIANHGWRTWLAAEVHICHLGRTPCLALIARPAGAYHVLPGMFAPETAWDDVVYSEVSGLLAAILAGVIISKKHLSSAHLPLRTGAFD